MQLSPTILSDARSLAAWGVFFCSYFVFALGKFPGLKIDEVDWGLLVFFVGLFIIVGVPSGRD